MKRSKGKPFNGSGMPKQAPHPTGDIYIAKVSAGVVMATINVATFGMAGAHWRDQLSGQNARKWGRIFIDPDKKECDERRRDALGPFRRLYAGIPENNCDECPGAMFYWDGPAYPAHVQPLCAVDNQNFGRKLSQALRDYLGPSPHWDWWEVKFSFR